MRSLYTERLYLNCYGYAESLLKCLAFTKGQISIEKALAYPILKIRQRRYK